MPLVLNDPIEFQPQRASNEIRVLPLCPFLVVIRTTPLAPREPYMAVEAASFKTVTDAISCGFMFESGFSFWAGTPSMTINADALFPVAELTPRTRIPISTPGWPSAAATCKPGMDPSKALETVDTFWIPITFESIWLTEPVRLALVYEP